MVTCWLPLTELEFWYNWYNYLHYYQYRTYCFSLDTVLTFPELFFPDVDSVSYEIDDCLCILEN